MSDQLQDMISTKCSTLSVCPRDCKNDITNLFTTCGNCLLKAEQLTQMSGLAQQKETLEGQKNDLQREIIACKCKDKWSYSPQSDQSTGKSLEQSTVKYYEGCDPLQPDEAEPWCYVKDPNSCTEATLSTGKNGEELGRRYCSSQSAPQQRLDKVMTALAEANTSIQQLQIIQKSCEADAPSLNTLHKPPISFPEEGTCMRMVKRFAILKEVMTAQETDNMSGLSKGAIKMLEELKEPLVQVLQNNDQCVTPE